MFPIMPYLRSHQRKHDPYLLYESEDRRTRIFGTLLSELGYSLLGRRGYADLKFHLLNPNVSKKIWNMLTKARETAEEWAGYYRSDFEAFIQAQIDILSQESLKGLWSRYTGGEIRNPHRLTLMLLVCSGPGAGNRYQQHQSDSYNPEPEIATNDEVDQHNSQLLQHLALRWHLPAQTFLLQTYRSGIFTSNWILQYPEFKKLVAQGLAEPKFVNDYLKTQETSTPCQRPLKSGKKSASPTTLNSHSRNGFKEKFSGRL